MNLLKKQLVKENYHKETLKITIDMAWPAIVESFFVAFAGLIDSLMVSSLGSYAVAAVGLTTQPKLLGLALFFALNVAISALVARRRGEKKQDSANEILLTAVLFIVIAAIISSIVFVLFAGAIIGLCGSTADTHNDAVVYFRIIMGGMIFNCIQMGINAAQRGAGNTKITMRTNVTSNTINILLNYLLINGRFGFPALGIRGAALATISGTVVACIMSVASIFKKRVFEYSIYIRAAYPPDFVCFSQSDQSCLQCLFRTGINANRFYVNRYYGCRSGDGCYGSASGRYEHYGTLLCVWRRSAGNGSCSDRTKLRFRRSGSCQRVRPHLSSHRCCHRCLSGCDLLFWCQRSLPSVFHGRPHCGNWSPDYTCHNLCCHFPDLPGHLHGMPAWCRRHALHSRCIHDKRHFHPYHHFLFLWLCPRLGDHRYLDGRAGRSDFQIYLCDRALQAGQVGEDQNLITGV